MKYKPLITPAPEKEAREYFAKRAFKCPICGRIFQNYEELDSHMCGRHWIRASRWYEEYKARTT